MSRSNSITITGVYQAAGRGFGFVTYHIQKKITTYGGCLPARI